MTTVDEEQVKAALGEVYDPEIPVNIYELGLVYSIVIDPQEDGTVVHIEMTLTAPGCPVAPMIIDDVKKYVGAIEGVEAVEVSLVFDPPWTPERMSQAARLETGMI